MLSRYFATASATLLFALCASASGAPRVNITAGDDGILQVKASHVFDAPLQDVLRAIIAFDRYGTTHPDIASADVLSKSDGRATVRFEMTDHPLAPKQWMIAAYRWAQRGDEIRITHRQTRGTFKANRGAYQLTTTPDGRTRLLYKARIGLGIAVPPSLVKSRVADGIKTFISRAAISVHRHARSTTRQAATPSGH